MKLKCRDLTPALTVIGFCLTLTHVFVILPDAALLLILTALLAEEGGHGTIKYKDMYNMDPNFSVDMGVLAGDFQAARKLMGRGSYICSGML